MNVRRLSLDEAEAALPELVAILQDCVANGASVNFVAPLSAQKAEEFWRARCFPGIRDGSILLLAGGVNGSIDGTVQVQLAAQENQPHRGEIAKMLVHSRARKCGLGAALLQAAERAAFEAGRTLLILDTESGSDAERLYRRGGWTPVGSIPGYALNATGDRLIATTIFYKEAEAKR